ncbi:MAG: hypothetical protein F8N15_01230 [Methanobacterium sp.]|nr:hypothetical protein [Methanobacterium sp.]
MPKSNAERQADYRRRQREGDGTRLSMIVPFSASMTLRRLAAHGGISQIEVLQTLLRNAERDLLAGMTAKEQSAYYDRVTA